MFKRSAAALLAALLVPTVVVASKHKHSLKDHHHHRAKEAPVVPVGPEMPPANVEAIVQNDQVCFFYVDDSLYILKPIINQDSNYQVSYGGESIDFNICNPVNNIQSAECQGSFACLTDKTGSKAPLSGTNFQANIIPAVKHDRENDTA